jgi:hypothetical protein
VFADEVDAAGRAGDDGRFRAEARPKQRSYGRDRVVRAVTVE